MKRRTFLRALAGAAATAIIGATGSRVAPTAARKVKPDLPPRKLVTSLYPEGITAYGDGTGQLWILDPARPRDQVFGFNPRDFGYQGDAKMYEAFARLEFEQRNLWPRSSRITGITAEIPDAL